MADVKISELPEVETLTGTETLVLVQSGTTSKTTLQTVLDLVTVPNEIPAYSTESGKVLTNNGTTLSWLTIPTEIPTVSGQSGKFLTNNGTTLSWTPVIDLNGSQFYYNGTSTIGSLILTTNSSATAKTNLGNTIYGYDIGSDITSGNQNTLMGYRAGQSLTTGRNNTFLGYNCGTPISTGILNTGVGESAIWSTHGSSELNTGVGYLAFSGDPTEPAFFNIAIGAAALHTYGSRSFNIAIGHDGGTQTLLSSNNIRIGHLTRIADPSAGNQLAIQNIIYGFANSGTEATVSTGRIAIGKKTDDGVNKLQISGPIVFVPATTATPTNNGEQTFELTSNTQLKIKVKGSDGVVRSTSLTLA
jgi:hypothetical protein